VDEFQDIDGIQYELVRLLSIRNASLFVVGDTDQAIYGWRGADAALMQYALDRDFPEIITFKLIRNYRSSSNILMAASALLRNVPNNWQMGSIKVLNLVPMKPPGEPICIQKLRSPVEEANFIAYEIQRLVNTNLATWHSFAILFRTHAQSFFIESSLISLKIPHAVIGSRPLYSHKEIQYVLAYLHLISNQENHMALERIINVPPRGIGERTLAEIKQWASAQKMTLPGALQLIHREAISHKELKITSKSRNALLQFWELIEGLRGLHHSETVGRIMEAVIESLQKI
jgi:DNA helicase-2/ATP-dependent DNA helicase PcrA